MPRQINQQTIHLHLDYDPEQVNKPEDWDWEALLGDTGVIKIQMSADDVAEDVGEYEDDDDL